MDMRAVIMAGGRGTRLAPFTNVFPKPLAPVGDMPILEIVMRQLAAQGVDRITVSIGYLGELIRSYLREVGGLPGVTIDYLTEHEPLGTAGPLAFIDSDEDLLVLNGDVLTVFDFRAFFEFHRATGSALTIAAHAREIAIDLGVLDIDHEHRLVAWREKPRQEVLCSMGINLFSPRARARIAPGQRCDVPDIARQLVADGEPVGVFRFAGYWRDIGAADSYALAQAEFAERRAELLGPADRESESPGQQVAPGGAT